VIRTSYDRAKGPDIYTDGLQDPRAKEVREREKDTDLALDQKIEKTETTQCTRQQNIEYLECTPYIVMYSLASTGGGT